MRDEETPAIQEQVPSRGAPPADADDGAAELIFGLVGPIGIDLDRVCAALSAELHSVGYDTRVVALDELVDAFLGAASDSGGIFDRHDAGMNSAAAFRESFGGADALARLGVAQIRVLRDQITGSTDAPANGVAYLVKALTRPEEISLLREVYRHGFTLVSAYAPRHVRLRGVSQALREETDRAEDAEVLAGRLVDRDHAAEDPMGHRVGDTFPAADYFVACCSEVALQSGMKRLIQLTFGQPFMSPTREEQSMFFAYAAGRRPSRLFDVIEYGRAVHAEMAAITQAAKEGRTLQGTRLYCTTFPCHLCARHIVASGISEIVFIEPYDKSRTDQMYPDSICVDADTPALDRTNLRRFQGAAPRRYVEYFAMGATPRKTADGKALTRLGRGTRLRFRTSVPLSYLLSEQQVLQESNLSAPNQPA